MLAKTISLGVLLVLAVFGCSTGERPLPVEPKPVEGVAPLALTGRTRASVWPSGLHAVSGSWLAGNDRSFSPESTDQMESLTLSGPGPRSGAVATSVPVGLR